MNNITPEQARKLLDAVFMEEMTAETSALLDHIAQLEAEVAALKEAERWIPVGEMLPDNTDSVLICKLTKKGVRSITIGYWLNDRWVSNGVAKVTHWMPLPELPEDTP